MVFIPFKIKIVGEQKTGKGAGMLSRARRATIRPYELRVVRDHGGGLWTFEDHEGQLYLAVLSREVSAFRRQREEARAADGSRYLLKGRRKRSSPEAA